MFDSEFSLGLQQKNLVIINMISSALDNLFENQQDDLLFVIAGRNITVSLFEKYLFADIQNRLHRSNKDSFDIKGDDPLIFDFIKRVSSYSVSFYLYFINGYF
jgi:hypothetical protein